MTFKNWLYIEIGGNNDGPAGDEKPIITAMPTYNKSEEPPKKSKKYKSPTKGYEAIRE